MKNDGNSLKPILKETYSKRKNKMAEKKERFQGLMNLFKDKEKGKKLVRKTTGQSDPYVRPSGDEVKETQNEKTKRMAEEANAAAKRRRDAKKK